jgi:hypothetical protein
MENFELGFTYVDQITGFTGVATGHVRYITGCNQVYLTPKVDADGKPRDGGWYDEQRLVRQEVSEVQVVLDNGKTPGFGPAAPAY